MSGRDTAAGEERGMLYFVKENKLHRYPVVKRCTAVYGKEQLRDTIPTDVEKCIYCLGSWPGDES
jgi:hypothetical protein